MHLWTSACLQTVGKKWIHKELVRLEDAVYSSLKAQVVGRLLARKGRLESELMKSDEPAAIRQKEAITKELDEIESMKKIEFLRKYRDSERVDWLCLSVINFAGRRTDRELELIYENLVWPSIHLPPWDDDSLQVTLIASIVVFSCPSSIVPIESLYIRPCPFQKLDELVASSSDPPDWEEIARQCNKHVMQCWEIYFGQKHTAATTLSDENLIRFYHGVRTRDYVPWLVIGKHLNTYR